MAASCGATNSKGTAERGGRCDESARFLRDSDRRARLMQSIYDKKRNLALGMVEQEPDDRRAGLKPALRCFILG